MSDVSTELQQQIDAVRDAHDDSSADLLLRVQQRIEQLEAVARAAKRLLFSIPHNGEPFLYDALVAAGYVGIETLEAMANPGEKEEA